MQAVAAAARQAARVAARQQLQQQAEAAAVSYMAAWRIARAWQAYRRGPAHARKLSAVVALQAAVRGAAARQLRGSCCSSCAGTGSSSCAGTGSS